MRPTRRGIIRSATAASLLPKTVFAQASSKKLSFLSWNIIDQQELFGTWFDGFKKSHPGVEIEWIDKKGPDLPAFYQTQLAAGTPPDVVDIQGALGLEWASQGALLDMTPMLKADTSVAQRFNQDYLSSWVLDGKNYLVPFYVAKSLLFLNRKMMDAAGLKEAPKSLDDLLAQAKAMSGGDRTGLMTLNFDWLYWPLYRMNGVDLLTPDLKDTAFNTPAGIAVTEALTRATADGSINKISWTGRWVEPNGAFAAGNVGIFHAHAPAYFFFKGQGDWVNENTVGVAELPGYWSTPNNHGLAISKGSQNPELAWEFIKFVTATPQASALAAKRKMILGQIEADHMTLAAMEKNTPFEATIMRTQIEHTGTLTGNWRIPNDSSVKNAFWPDLQSAFLGRKDAKTALADAERKVRRELKRG